MKWGMSKDTMKKNWAKIYADAMDWAIADCKNLQKKGDADAKAQQWYDLLIASLIEHKKISWNEFFADM